MANKSIENTTCTVCGSASTQLFLQTNAMMHAPNVELYSFYSCNNCESKFLRNPVNESELSQYYTENYLPYRGAAAWGVFAKFVEWDDEKLNKARKKAVLPYLHNTSTNRILDVGCGKPDFLLEMSQLENVDVVGVDFVEADWENPKYSNLTLQACDWKNANFDSQFDLITAWHYLEHDYDLNATESRFYDLLKVGGHVVIEVPMFEGFLQKIQKTFWQGWHSPRHITLFSKKSWTILFPTDKWEIVTHKQYGTLSAFTLWWLGYRQKRNTNWAGSMEPYFWSLVFLKVMLFPIFMLEKIIPFGVQTVVFKKRS